MGQGVGALKRGAETSLQTMISKLTANLLFWVLSIFLATLTKNEYINLMSSKYKQSTSPITFFFEILKRYPKLVTFGNLFMPNQNLPKRQ